MPETSDHASAVTAPTTVLDQSAERHLDNLYRAAVGPIQADYYLPILSRFETYGRASPSWNWAACACTLNWMLFRGLWLPTLVYLFAIAAAVALVGNFISQANPPLVASMRWSLWASLATIALLVPGFFGNAWLYRVYRQRLDAALARTNSLQDACTMLARQSSARPRLLAIALANLSLAMLLAIGFWPTAKPMRVWPHASGAVEKPTVPTSASAPTPPEAVIVSAAEPVPPTAQSQAQAQAPALATPPAAAAATATSATLNRTPAPPPPDRGKFLINVGLFAQQDNALRVFSKLKAAGLPATSTPIETPNGPRNRIRVGPFTSRAQADAAARKIRTLQLDAVVVRQ